MATSTDLRSTHPDDPTDQLSQQPEQAVIPLAQRPEAMWIGGLLATVLTLAMGVTSVIDNAGSGLPDMAPARIAGGLLLAAGVWMTYDLVGSALQWGRARRSRKAWPS